MFSPSVTIATGAELLRLSFARWPLQRPLSEEWAAKIVEDQLELHRSLGCFVFTGAFVAATLEGKTYLLDGQHRLEALRRLRACGHDVGFAMPLVTYACADARHVKAAYWVANNGYSVNGMVAERAGETYEADGEAAKELQAQLLARFPGHFSPQKEKAPYANIGALIGECNKRGLLKPRSAGALLKAIVALNAAFGKELARSEPAKYDKCANMGGFYLAYKKPRCRWVGELAEALGPKRAASEG